MLHAKNFEFKQEVEIAVKEKKQVATQLETASYQPAASIGYCRLDHMQPNTCTQ